MTQRTSNYVKLLVSSFNLSSRWSWSSWSGQPNRIHKRVNIGTTSLGMRIFRGRVEDASFNQVSFVRHYVVADAHLHVISFPGKNCERLVLGLPPELHDRSIVATKVKPSSDS